MAPAIGRFNPLQLRPVTGGAATFSFYPVAVLLSITVEYSYYAFCPVELLRPSTGGAATLSFYPVALLTNATGDVPDTLFYPVALLQSATGDATISLFYPVTCQLATTV